MLGVMLLLTALGVVAGSAMSTQRGNCPAVQSEKSKADRSRGRAAPAAPVRMMPNDLLSGPVNDQALRAAKFAFEIACRERERTDR